ncbi:glycosyltransferase [Salinibacter ruber]|uniref:glycosyltransferase n=1 Tax=Salinibacter ruber TaxID=146919 RepID=UPI00216733BA|nr:glycosyltransferase [Salinibacter ruber]MCS4223271.1 glycosyltransferase involved in cell wall biosynthesis [Salinibacter ruber]
MAVYNERPYLKGAVRSILEQTLADFEFIIVNDGSTDGTKEVLDQFADRDERIRCVHQENRGLIASLNRGLDMARGKYIARMDADDISYERRFEHQVRFLDQNPSVGVLGTQTDIIDDKGQIVDSWDLPTDPNQVAWFLLFGNCFCHPSVMMRSSLIEELGGYSGWARDAEDYELWSRAFLESRLSNLSDTLLKYRTPKIDGRKERKNQYNTERATVCNLHEKIFEEESDRKAAVFIMTMKEYGVKEAVKRCSLENPKRALRYIKKVYYIYSKKIKNSFVENEARKNFVLLQDLIKGIRINGKRKASFKEKLKSRIEPPWWEVFPWLYYYYKEKVKQKN